MRKNSYAAVLDARQLRRDEFVRHHTRVFMMDMVTLALGRLGWGEKSFEKFDRMLTEVAAEYSKLIVSDTADDDDMVYAKACIDREIKRYVGKRFIPYDERYKF